jgi:hypothetical protein
MTKIDEAFAKVTRGAVKDREAALAIEVELDMLATALVKDGHVSRGADFLSAITLLVKTEKLDASVLEAAVALENLLADVHYSPDRYAQEFLADIEQAYGSIIAALETGLRKRPAP